MQLILFEKDYNSITSIIIQCDLKHQNILSR